MRRAALAVGVVCIAAAIATAAPGHDPDIEALLDRARILPSEFAIDLLLRFAGSPRISDTAWKRELVEDAWNRTYWVQEPYRLMAVRPPADSRASAQTLGYDMRLDRISLQARAARTMATLSPSRA